MRYRVIEQPWEVPARRFAVQEHVDADLWRYIREFENEQAARDCMQLYAAGPRVIAESRGASDSREHVPEHHEFGANALQ